MNLQILDGRLTTVIATNAKSTTIPTNKPDMLATTNPVIPEKMAKYAFLHFKSSMRAVKTIIIAKSDSIPKVIKKVTCIITVMFTQSPNRTAEFTGLVTFRNIHH